MTKPIGPDDIISVQGRYFVKKDETRFLMKGIAFPIPIPNNGPEYDPDGWIAVLEQLAALTDVNVVRLYLVDCTVDYTEFLERAAELGIYVIVPLTASSGHGVLNRNKHAPACYPRKLFNYGKKCLDQFSEHPNVIAGTIGNEVMNSLQTWKAGPCIRAYARDLKGYMQSKQSRLLPLMYASQHDSMTAEILPSEAMKITLDYLSCDIDVYGINVETWCSSLQKFKVNEDGSEADYYTLWKTLRNTSIPIIFSEMGCSRDLFNRDNGLPRHVRDWAQIPVVLKDMADTFSGFCAYAYAGNSLFSMMDGHWNGHDILPPTDDFYNFREQLQKVSLAAEKVSVSPPPINPPSSCDSALSMLEEKCDLKVYPMHRMPSYYESKPLTTAFSWLVAVLVVVSVGWAFSAFRKKPEERRTPSQIQTTYQSISSEDLEN